ncbi:MAG: CbtA family protein [Parvibaculaceae bacterium]|nr:CbtA family protein [Parvibaculaceae bacterium]
MVGILLMRGMLVGIVAGLLAFGFAKTFGEPQVDRAITFESQIDAAKGEAPEPELVSREVQSSIGLLTGVIVYSTAIGGLFSLVFAYAYGRVGNIGPRALSALLAAAGLLSIIIVPELKYPANPPSVGNPDTIGLRTELYFVMVLISLAALTVSVIAGRRLAPRHGAWNATLIGSALFVVLIAVAQILLRDINEVPAEFPAVVLWRFRVAALGIQFVLWGTLGLLFGYLTERSMSATPARRVVYQ